MSIEATAGQKALRTAGQKTHNYDRSKDKLLADLKVLVVDAKTLLNEAADCSADGYAALRARLESKLADTRAKIDRTRAVVGEKTKFATDATHAYVRENPWQSAGVLAAAGVIVGFCLGRRSAGIDADDPLEQGG